MRESELKRLLRIDGFEEHFRVEPSGILPSVQSDRSQHVAFLARRAPHVIPIIDLTSVLAAIKQRAGAQQKQE